jgi:hypothetical protein
MAIHLTFIESLWLIFNLMSKKCTIIFFSGLYILSSLKMSTLGQSVSASEQYTHFWQRLLFPDNSMSALIDDPAPSIIKESRDSVMPGEIIEKENRI